MTMCEMIDVVEELKAIIPSVAWSDELTNLVNKRILSLQTQVDEYNSYIDQLAEAEEERLYV